MDASRVDQISKTLVASACRRTLVRGGLAAVAAMVASRPRAAAAQGRDCAELCAGVTGERRGGCQYRCAQGLEACEIFLCPPGFRRDPFTCSCEPDRGNPK